MTALKGGAKLLAKLGEVQRKMATGSVLRVGFLEGAMHPSKSPNGEPVPVAQVAAWNEWGDPDNNRPPRPFFRTMVEEKKDGWGRSMANILKANGYDVNNALQLMGQGIKGQLQHSINEFTDPPLADSTIKAKGFDKPLVDTGDMLRGVAYEITGVK